MAMIQVGPMQFMDEALARKQGRSRYIPTAAAKVPAKRAAPAPAPVRRAAPPAAIRRKPGPQPKTIPEAMKAGLTNEEIHRLLNRGDLEECKTAEEAGRKWWKPEDVREASRRGLIW